MTPSLFWNEFFRARCYLDVADTIVLVVDRHGRVASVNQRGMAVLGWREDELVGRSWLDVVVPADREAAESRFVALLSGELEEARLECAVHTRDGDERIVDWHSAGLRQSDGTVTATLNSGHDVTDQRRTEQEVADLAYRDSLTGLPNRALLGEHLDLALARARQHGEAVALLHVDLDDFKLVNDSLGHAAGDQVLCQVTGRLQAVLSPTDLLARQSGDELLLLVPDIDGDAGAVAEAVAGKVQAALADPLSIDGTDFNVTATTGVSIFPSDAQDAETLLKHADAAMYQAKEGGGDGFGIYADGTLAALTRLSLTTRLRQALDRGELLLHYQPIFRLPDRHVVTLEALIRWDDPKRGVVMPVEFIPVAEETGMIGAIGEWVLDAICAQALSWAEAGREARISFNVSARQFRHPDFAALVADKLSAYGLEPSAFTMEVTESTAMQQPERVEPILRSLHELGVRLAIDDFGAGYSSLSRLRHLPAQILKIDRSFMSETPEDSNATRFVDATMQLAAALGMDAVAEGVETEPQREYLVARGCVLAQGFHLARPLPAEEVTDLLPWRDESAQPGGSVPAA